MSKNLKNAYNIEEQIDQYMGLVIKIVDSYNPINYTQRQDWLDAGRIGLWKGLKEFDPSKECNVSTYIWRPINWAILQEQRKENKHYGNVSLQSLPDLPVSSAETNIQNLIPHYLSGEEKEVIDLKKKGHSIKEISEIIKKSTASTNKVYKSAIKKILRANE